MKMSKKILIVSLIIFLNFIASFTIYGAETVTDFSQTTNETLRIADLQLQLEKQRYEWAKQDLQRSKVHQQEKQQYYKTHPISLQDLDKVSLLINNSKTALGNIQIAVADANENILFTENELAEMTKHPERTNQAQGKDIWESLLKIQQQRLDYLNRTEDLTSIRLQQLQSWQQDLNQWYQVQKHQQDEFSLAVYQEKLQVTQQQLLQKLTNLTNELNAINSTTIKKDQRLNLQFQIFEAQEKLSINHLQLFLTQLQNRVHTIALTLPESNTISDLQDRQEEASLVLSKVVHVKSVVKEKLQLLQNHLKALKPSDATFGAYQNLIQAYQDEYQKITNLQTHIDKYQNQISTMLAHRFTIRQTLPGLNLMGWIQLGQQVLLMPKMTADIAQDLIKEIWLQFKFQRNIHLYAFILLELILLVSWWFLRKTFRQLLCWLAESSRRFSGQLLRTILLVAGKNLGIIWIVVAISLLYFILDIGQVTLFLFLAIIYLFYQSSYTLLKMSAIEKKLHPINKQEKFYSQLNKLLNIGAFLTILITFSHFLPVTYEVKTLMNKLFMIFLLIGSWILFRARSRLPIILQQVFAVRRNYILQVIRLICWVLPITLLINAFVGLVGYIDLAWKIGGYQISTFIILATYMIVRGLLIDFMELNYELLIRHFKSGWLWAQSLIRPLDRVLRIVLFFVALLFLLHDFSLDHNRAFIGQFQHLLSTPFINIGSMALSLNITIGAFFYVAFLFWLARWSREFAFRWFFIRTKDIGLRNSLAVFTQYLAIMIALLLGLKLFGLDLKGLAVVAAAFAAGMGFALRDLASNFISGIMLLIERPFRTGDTITLGEHEGEVVGTGMRSMKIQTWDHTEVIVPNADMFTKPFVNWTHQDSIVRSVVKITVNREDDPHKIQKIIYQVLKTIPEVSNTPNFEVFMKEMSDTLLEFEVRYYVDMKKIESRSEVRSAVLFSIWDAFKENGIQTPYTRYDVQVLK